MAKKKKTAKGTTKKTGSRVASKKVANRPHRAPAPTFENITVKNGVAYPTSLDVPAGGLIHFTNEDRQDYLIELYVDSIHPVVGVLLMAKDDCKFIADPNARPGDHCHYNLVPTVLKINSATISPISGGNHVIIITSGLKQTS
jgi:hypothetical protein